MKSAVIKQRIRGRQPSGGDPELTALRIFMLQHSIGQRELAAQVGIKLCTFRNILTGNNRNWLPRVRINRALGIKVFSIPQKIARKYGSERASSKSRKSHE